MVLPILGALIGAGGSVASGILGANATNNAAAYNYYVDLLNYRQREQERMDTIQQAKRAERDQKLGGTDAHGNRTHFVEGVGWVTDLSDEQNRLRDLYTQEELAQLTQDLPMRRRRMQTNDARQDQEGLLADRLLDAFARQRVETPRDIELQLNEAAVHGITKGFDSALEDGMRASLRTGSNAGKVDAKVGEQRANALMQAFLNNRVNAKSMAKDSAAQDQANLANLYNMFATRASAMPDVSFQPQNIGGMTAAQQAQYAQMAQGGMSALVNAMAKQGGSLGRIEPNFGAANAVGMGANSLAGAFERIGAGQDKNKMQDMYMQYVFGGGNPQTAYRDMFKSTTGTF